MAKVCSVTTIAISWNLIYQNLLFLPVRTHKTAVLRYVNDLVRVAPPTCIGVAVAVAIQLLCQRDSPRLSYVISMYAPWSVLRLGLLTSGNFL